MIQEPTLKVKRKSMIIGLDKLKIGFNRTVLIQSREILSHTRTNSQENIMIRKQARHSTTMEKLPALIKEQDKFASQDTKSSQKTERLRGMMTVLLMLKVKSGVLQLPQIQRKSQLEITILSTFLNSDFSHQQEMLLLPTNILDSKPKISLVIANSMKECTLPKNSNNIYVSTEKEITLEPTRTQFKIQSSTPGLI